MPIFVNKCKPSLDNNPRRKQIFSRYLVEHKKHGRSLPAVINGLSVSDAQAQGLVHDSDAENGSVVGSESLFVNGDSDDERKAPRSRSTSPLPQAPIQANGVAKLSATASPFQTPSAFGTPSTFGSPSTYGASSSKPNPFNPLQSAQSQSNPISVFGSTSSAPVQAPNPFAPKESPKINFFPASNENKTATTTTGSSPFGNSAAPNFSFFPHAAKAAEPQNVASNASADGPKPTSQGVFGKPSKPPPADAPAAPKGVFSLQPAAPTAPMFSSQTPPLFASSTPSELNQNETKSVLGTQPEAAAPSEAKPSPFSFGTSPMFAAAAKEVQSEAKPSSTPSSTFNPPNFSFSNAFTSHPPHSSLFPPASPLTKPTTNPSMTTSDLHSKTPVSFIPQAPVSASSPHFDFQAPTNTASPPKTTQIQEPSQAPVAPLKSQPAFFPSPPPTKPQEAQRTGPTPTPTVPGSTLKSLKSVQAPTQPTIEQAPPDPRPEALDKLTDGLIFDAGGLLQQYIEVTIQPIIQAAVDQYEDEKSWQEARQ